MDDARDPRPRGRARTVGAPIGRRPARSLGVPAAVVALVCAVTACDSTSTSTAGSGARSSGTDSSSAATASSTPASSSATGIVIEFDGRQVAGSLDPSPTSASLLAQLPLELSFGDHAGQEKSARLPTPLSLDGAPERSAAAPLTIGYYVPEDRKSVV